MEVIAVIEGQEMLISSKDIKLYKGMKILIPADLKRYKILENISMLITNYYCKKRGAINAGS